MGLVKTEQHPDIGQYVGVKGPITVLGILIHIWQKPSRGRGMQEQHISGELGKN